MKKNECELYSEFHRKENKPHDKFSFRKEDMQKEVKKDEEEEDSVCLCNKTKVNSVANTKVKTPYWIFVIPIPDKKKSCVYSYHACILGTTQVIFFLRESDDEIPPIMVALWSTRCIFVLLLKKSKIDHFHPV